MKKITLILLLAVLVLIAGIGIRYLILLKRERAGPVLPPPAPRELTEQEREKILEELSKAAKKNGLSPEQEEKILKDLSKSAPSNLTEEDREKILESLSK